jgi:hypothetical protein
LIYSCRHSCEAVEQLPGRPITFASSIAHSVEKAAFGWNPTVRRTAIVAAEIEIAIAIAIVRRPSGQAAANFIGDPVL